MVAARHFRSPWHTGGNQSAVTVLSRRTSRRVRPIIAGESDMRAHQPGSTPIDIPETVPNPAHTPAPAPAPERAPTKVPEKVPEKVIAPESSGAFFFLSVVNTPSRREAASKNYEEADWTQEDRFWPKADMQLH